MLPESRSLEVRARRACRAGSRRCDRGSARGGASRRGRRPGTSASATDRRACAHCHRAARPAPTAEPSPPGRIATLTISPDPTNSAYSSLSSEAPASPLASASYQLRDSRRGCRAARRAVHLAWNCGSHERGKHIRWCKVADLGDVMSNVGSELQQLQGRLADQLAALAAAPFEQIDAAIVEARSASCVACSAWTGRRSGRARRTRQRSSH